MKEIRPSEEPIEQSGEVRQLMKSGEWINRPPDWERYEGEIDAGPTEPAPIAFKDPPPVQPRSKPKVKPKSTKRGRPVSPSNPLFTGRAVLEMQRQGKTLNEIAVHFNCKVNTVSMRLLRDRKADHELDVDYAALKANQRASRDYLKRFGPKRDAR